MITEKKIKQYVRQTKHINQEDLPTKVIPDIGFTDETVVPYDVPVVEKTFLDDCN